MIEEQFYVNENLEYALAITDLEPDELESVVGRFRAEHWRFPGLLRGEVLLYTCGKVVIRHHFTKKKLWTSV